MEEYLQHWNFIYPKPTNRDLFKIVSDPVSGEFIAVGADTTILLSKYNEILIANSGTEEKTVKNQRNCLLEQVNRTNSEEREDLTQNWEWILNNNLIEGTINSVNVIDAYVYVNLIKNDLSTQSYYTNISNLFIPNTAPYWITTRNNFDSVVFGNGKIQFLFI